MQDSEGVLQDLLRKATTAQQRQDYDDAAVWYEAIIRVRPDIPEAWANLGLMYYLLGRNEQAINSFEAALRRNPKLFTANFFLGATLLRTRKAQPALRFLDQAQRLNPRDEQVIIKLGDAYAAMRDYSNANRWYGRAVVLNPNSADANYGLGVTYLHLHEAAVERLARIGRDSMFAQLLLAQALAQERRTADAIRLYREIANSQPALIGVGTELGFVYLQNHELLEARREFEMEIQKRPGFLPARFGLAQVLFEQGHLVESCLELKKVWECDVGFAQANIAGFWRDLSAQQQRDIQRVLRRVAADSNLIAYLDRMVHESIARGSNDSGSQWEDSEVSTGHSSDEPEAFFAQGHYVACSNKLLTEMAVLNPARSILLTRCSYYAGNYRVALQTAEQAAKVEHLRLEALYWQAKATAKLANDVLLRFGLEGENSTRVHLLLAQAYEKVKNYERSELEYRRALKLNPDNCAAHLGLAGLYCTNRDFERAMPELQTVLVINPNDPEANYLMGAILVGRREYLEAQPRLVLSLAAGGQTAGRAHALLGKVYAASHQTRKAIQEFNKALTVDTDGSVHYQLFRLYKEIGEEKAAAVALEGCKRIKSENARAAIDSALQ